MKKIETPSLAPVCLALDAVTGGMPSSSFRSSNSTRRESVKWDSNPPREHSYYTYMGKSDQAKYESLSPKWQEKLSTKSPSE